MKKNLIALGLLCSLASCKKSNSSINTNVSITGKWYHTKTVLTAYQGGIAEPVETTNFTDPKPSITFNSDGSGTIVEATGNSGTTEPFTYKVSDKVLTIIDNGDTETDNITSLTSATLSLHSDTTYTTTQGTYRDIVDDYFTR